MFRARIGNQSSSGNKVLRERLEIKKKEERERRLNKIKNRKPFSSKVTLDNAPPVVIEAMKSNPRKKALQVNFNIVTEQQNMCMLKRISTILTAPPKITDAEYKAMKKLCPTLRGLKEVYEHNIILEHNKQFFQRLKGIDAYYNPHEWERDYQLQKKGQKFMRQVTYERPKGFVDPRGLDDPVNLQKLNSVSGSMETREPATNHVNRVRSIKTGGAEPAAAATRRSEDRSRVSPTHATGNRGHPLRSSSSSGPASVSVSMESEHGFSKHHKGSVSNPGGGAGGLVSSSSAGAVGSATRYKEARSNTSSPDYDQSEFEDVVDTEAPVDDAARPHEDEIRIELCSTRRSMHISDFLTVADLAEFPPEDLMDHLSPRVGGLGLGGTPSPVVVVDMDVKCYLVGNVDLVISAITCKGQPLFIETEAEAPVSELCAINGLPPLQRGSGDPEHHDIEQDMRFIEMLESLAREIAATVEIKIEDDVPRLILNLADKRPPFAMEDDDEYGDADFDAYDTRGLNAYGTDEDVEALLLDPVVREKDLEVKVKFLVQTTLPMPAPVAGAGGQRSSVAYTQTAAPVVIKQVIETMPISVHMSSTKDDKIDVKITFRKNSEMKKTDKKSMSKSAIEAGCEILTSTGLPSIMQADNDLISEFFDNLLSSIHIEHAVSTGDTKVSLD